MLTWELWEEADGVGAGLFGFCFVMFFLSAIGQFVCFFYFLLTCSFVRPSCGGRGRGQSNSFKFITLLSLLFFNDTDFCYTCAVLFFMISLPYGLTNTHERIMSHFVFCRVQ